MTNDPETGESLIHGELPDDLDVFELTNEAGETLQMALLAVVELEGLDYGMLAPVDQLLDEDDEEPLEMHLFRYVEQEDGTVAFHEIDDEDTYVAVRDYCMTLVDLGDVDVDDEAEEAAYSGDDDDA